MRESTTTEHSRVRQLLDDAALCRIDDPARARKLSLEARILSRASETAADEAEALCCLASIAHQGGRTDEAFALAAEAVDVSAGGEPTPSLAWSHHLLGVVHFEANNFAAALEQSRLALASYRATGHQVDEGKILHTIAAIHQAMGDDDRAIETYENALAINEPLGRLELDVIVLGNLADLHRSRDEFLPAVTLGRRAVELAREHAPELLGGLLAGLAEAYVGLADHDSATQCFAEARADWKLRVADGHELAPIDHLGITLAEGRVALRSGQVDEAIALLSAALDLAARTVQRDVELEIHDLLATAFKDAERFDKALEHRERHFALHREIFDDSAALRLRTLQVAHSNQTARHRAEITRLQSSELVNSFGAPHADVDAYHLEAFERLAALAEFRGGNTTKHTGAVGDLSAEIAHAIGQPPEWCERLRLAARLHDVGKVAISDSVLLKPGPLTIEEFDEVKRHTVLGRRLLSGVSTELFALAAEAAWTHHEWWDGTGYPNGISGKAIPLAGRIVAIADVYDSLATRKVYKREWNLAEAVRFVKTGAGAQFQPELVDAFVSVMIAHDPTLEAELA